MSAGVIRNRVGMSAMMLRFGKYRGSSAGRVVLADPGYAAWALGQPSAAGGLADLRREVLRLVGRYDARPVVAGCFTGGCRRPATGCTLYRGRADPYWWCDACDPVGGGGGADKLVRVRSYWEAWGYGRTHAGGSEAAGAGLVAAVAAAKGLPARATEADVAAFFAAAAPGDGG